MFRLIKGFWHYISGVERLWSDYGIHREDYAQRYAKGITQGIELAREDAEPPVRPVRRAQFPSLLSQDDASLGRSNIIDDRPGKASFGTFDRRPLARIYIRLDGTRWYAAPVFAEAA